MRLPYRDEKGSLPIAVLLTMVGLLLSTLLLNTVLQQGVTTRSEIARVSALNAAQSGLDVGMGHLRAANDGNGNGVLASLPCALLAGVPASGTRSTYSVTIGYYPTDPQNRSTSWLAANAITCLSGGGAYSTPAYALLTSKGTYTAASGAKTNRTLYATYTFKTTNLNLPGGLVHEYRASTSTTDLCWDAGSGSPIAGTAVQLQPCTTGSVRQTWSYNLNLTLSLVSSKTSSQPLGMCIDAGTPHSAGATVYLQACATTTIPQQQWSYNDDSNWEGTADGSTLDGYCINAQTPSTKGSFLILGKASTACRKSSSPNYVFYPEPTIGAGAAGAAASQLVNFKQFGRCLDVTSQSVSATFLISWQCKQAPNPSNVAWNQKWALPAIPDGTTGITKLISTNPGSGLYCLRSPRSVASAMYVTVTSCTSTATNAELMWTFYGNTGTYATSYTIADADKHCLSPTDPNAASPDLFSGGQNVSKIVVAVCDGSSLQKWNAPASLLQALPLKDIAEQ